MNLGWGSNVCIICPQIIDGAVQDLICKNDVIWFIRSSWIAFSTNDIQSDLGLDVWCPELGKLCPEEEMPEWIPWFSL